MVESLPLQRLEEPFRDWHFRARAAWQPAVPHPEIILVATDAQSLEEIQVPLSFWPVVYAEVLERLVQAEAKVIAPDLLWQLDPASVRGLGPASETLEKSLLEEEVRTAVLVGNAPIVVGAHRDGEVVNLPRDSLLAMAGDRLALLNLNEDKDGVVRRQHLAIPTALEGEVYDFPCFAAKISELAGKADFSSVPLDRDQTFWINFRGPHGSFTTVSLAELLKTEDLSPFRHRIVILGSYDARLHDLRRSPFSRSGAPDMFGVEIHANSVATLLDGNFLRQPHPATEIAASLLLAGLVALLFTFLSPFLAFVAILMLLGLWWTTALLAFTKLGLWLNMSGKMVLLALVALGCYTLRFLQVERSRKLATTLFGRYAPVQVVDQLLNEPKFAKLGGSSAEVTLLFCDIDGFSTVSENVPPEELIDLINVFFTEMAQIIHQHGGVIRQFVGDEIMVIFGAPTPQPNHAEAAVKTAVAAGRRLRTLEKESHGKLGFYRMKTGIHSGRVICGNVGSEERMEYTAVGDDVNLASRVMGLNSILKTEILITRETRDQLGSWSSDLTICPRGSQPVKGRDQEVDLFEIVLEEKQE